MCSPLQRALLELAPPAQPANRLCVHGQQLWLLCRSPESDAHPALVVSQEVVIDEAVADGQSQGNPVTYLYRLAPTLSLESHAAACAKSQGISNEIIKRSEEVRWVHLSPFSPFFWRPRSPDSRAQDTPHPFRVSAAPGPQAFGRRVPVRDPCLSLRLPGENGV